MYTYKKVEPIQGEQCLFCRHYGWEIERQRNVCWICGCINFSCFNPYNKQEWKEYLDAQS